MISRTVSSCLITITVGMTASAPAQQYNAVLFNCTSAGPEVRLLAMTLAGIVNRDSARLYLLNCYETWSYTNTDETWRDAYRHNARRVVRKYHN